MTESMRAGEVQPWRDSLLRGVLTVTAILAVPASVGAWLGMVSPAPLSAAATLAFGVVLPVLRFVPGLSLATRVRASIGAVVALALVLYARVGFEPGLALTITMAAVLIAIYLGRRFGLTLLAFVGVAIVSVGWLATSDRLHLDPRNLDASVAGNWARVSVITTLLTALLTLTVDVAIRHLEAGARATNQALRELGRLRDRLEQSKEEERQSLARELHDELGQMLNVLKQRIQIEGRTPPTETVTLVDDLIGRVRKLSANLRSAAVVASTADRAEN